MSKTVGRVGTRIAQVAAHLVRRGHISEGTATIEYGRFRLSDIIHRLRNERPDLLPEGHEIVTITKRDTQGNSYGEYHLVSQASAEPRRVAVEGRVTARELRASLAGSAGRVISDDIHYQEAYRAIG